MSRSDRPKLVTIPISHFCEKARWALDRAGVRYAKPFVSFNLTGVPGWERAMFPVVLAPAKVYINRSAEVR